MSKDIPALTPVRRQIQPYDADKIDYFAHEIADKYLNVAELISTGKSTLQACEECGVLVASYFKYRKNHPIVQKAHDRAVEIANAIKVDAVSEALYKVAIGEATEERTAYDAAGDVIGKQVIKHSPDVKAATTFLNNRAPEEWTKSETPPAQTTNIIQLAVQKALQDETSIHG